jgi:hypothetical protein
VETAFLRGGFLFKEQGEKPKTKNQKPKSKAQVTSCLCAFASLRSLRETY